MIWEDEKPDHDANAGTGILVALPFAVFLWAAAYWGSERVMEMVRKPLSCGEMTYDDLLHP